MTVETPVETRTPMSWDDFEVLETTAWRAEYFGGELVTYSAPSRRHQEIVLELAIALRGALPAGASMTIGWGWSPDEVREELTPDLMVHRSADDKRLSDSVPLLVVEVLSSNRRTDLVDKMFRYARWGAGTYWVVDPRDHELVVHDLDDGMFRTSAVHTGGLVVAEYAGGRVDIDLDDLLRRPG